jgi:chaperonin GroES
MNLRPLHDWAVIVPSEAETKTAGGIFIPDTAKEKPAEGVVEAIGPGALEEEKHGKKKTEEKKERKFIPTTVKPGDRILYEEYAGQKITIDNKERVLVREKNILGTLPAKPVAPSGAGEEISLAELKKSVQPSAAPVKKPVSKKAPVKAAPKATKKAAKKATKKAAKKPAAKKATAKPSKTSKVVKKAAKKKKK